MKRSKFQLLLALFVMAMLFSCGGSDPSEDPDDNGKTNDPKKAASQLEKPMNDAEAARAAALEAEADKFAQDTWDEAEGILTEAEDLAEEGDTSQARRSFFKAKSRYQSAISKAKSNKAALGEYTKAAQELQALMGQAEKAKVGEFLPDDLKRSKDKLAEAEQAKGSDARKAKTLVREGVSILKNAIYEAQEKARQEVELAKNKARALEEKKIMEEKKKFAEDMDPEKKRATDYQYIEEIIREGDRAFADKRYQEAELNYRDAKNAYLQLAQTIASAKRFAEQNKQTGNTSPGANYNPGEVPVPQPSSPNSPNIPDAAVPDNMQPTDFGGTAIEILIQNNLTNLFAAPATWEDGKVQLDYTNGAHVQKDALPGYSTKKVIGFAPQKDAVITNRSFQAGGSFGYLYLQPMFKSQVTVTCEVTMELFGPPNPYVVMSGLSTHRLGFGTLFGNFIGGIVNGKFRQVGGSSNPKAQGGVNDLLDKRNAYEWKLIIDFPDSDEKATITSFYDGSKTAEMRQKNDPEKHPSGRVGFIWNSCRFLVQNMRIEGKLDPEWVIKTLQKKKIEVPDDALIEAGLKKAPKTPKETPPVVPGGPGGEVKF